MDVVLHYQDGRVCVKFVQTVANVNKNRTYKKGRRPNQNFTDSKRFCSHLTQKHTEVSAYL